MAKKKEASSPSSSPAPRSSKKETIAQRWVREWKENTDNKFDGPRGRK